MSTTKAPPPPPTKKPPSPSIDNGQPVGRKEFAVSRGVVKTPEKIVFYGPGGIGKTSIAASLKEAGVNPLFLDVGKGSHKLDVDRIADIDTWDDLRAAIQSESLWSGYDAVVIDDLTTCEELAIAWTLANVTNDKGHTVNSIEGYGFGKGFTHAYETFLHLFQDLDRHVREGRHVVCIAHECTATVPNPLGEDWIRYEPRLQSPNSGKASIRYRCREWCDHLIYVGYDVAVSKDGKGQGSGTRTFHPTEFPTHVAKSRSLAEPIPYEKGSTEFWNQLFNEGEYE